MGIFYLDPWQKNAPIGETHCKIFEILLMVLQALQADKRDRYETAKG